MNKSKIPRILKAPRNSKLVLQGPLTSTTILDYDYMLILIIAIYAVLYHLHIPVSAH